MRTGSLITMETTTVENDEEGTNAVEKVWRVFY